MIYITLYIALSWLPQNVVKMADKKNIVYGISAQEQLASNPAVKGGENAAWIQLFRMCQPFPEIWEFEYFRRLSVKYYWIPIVIQLRYESLCVVSSF